MPQHQTSSATTTGVTAARRVHLARACRVAGHFCRVHLARPCRVAISTTPLPRPLHFHASSAYGRLHRTSERAPLPTGWTSATQLSTTSIQQAPARYDSRCRQTVFRVLPCRTGRYVFAYHVRATSKTSFLLRVCLSTVLKPPSLLPSFVCVRRTLHTMPANTTLFPSHFSPLPFTSHATIPLLPHAVHFTYLLYTSTYSSLW